MVMRLNVFRGEVYLCQRYCFRSLLHITSLKYGHFLTSPLP